MLIEKRVSSMRLLLGCPSVKLKLEWKFIFGILLKWKDRSMKLTLLLNFIRYFLVLSTLLSLNYEIWATFYMRVFLILFCLRFLRLQIWIPVSYFIWFLPQWVLHCFSQSYRWAFQFAFHTFNEFLHNIWVWTPNSSYDSSNRYVLPTHYHIYASQTSIWTPVWSTVFTLHQNRLLNCRILLGAG